MRKIKWLLLLITFLTTAGVEAAENLLTNPGFEDGTTSGWTPVEFGSSSIEAATVPRTGNYSALVFNSIVAPWNGIDQSILGEANDGQTYAISGYVKLQNSDSDDIVLMVQQTDGSGTQYYLIMWSTVNNTTWTELSGHFTLNVSGTLTALHLFFAAPDGGVNFYVDDASLIVSDTDWKTEANARIEQIRKGDFRITAISPYGSKPPVPDVNVQVSQIKHHFAFGTALAYSPLNSNTNYQNFVLDHFEWAVCENETKWSSNEGTRNVEDYYQADYMYNWCASNGITMRGHCVFWEVENSQMPSWVPSLDYEPYPTPSELLTEVEERIDSAVNHFKGKFVHWDVDNEMLHGLFFRDRLGPDIHPWMFQTAHAIDPNCMLFVNDYSVIAGGYSLYDYKEQIYGLLDDGAPVHGIGVQCHFGGSSIDPYAVYDRLDSLAEVGLPIWCSEYDFEAEDDYVRADGLEKFYRTAFSHPAVEGILMWGFWEGSHWRVDCHIVNTNWTLNAAGRKYEALLDEWTTNDSSITDSNGNADLRGFYGTYTVTLTPYRTNPTVTTIEITPDGPNEFAIELTDMGYHEIPTGLSATAGDAIVWLDWDDNNDPNFAGYNIYRSTTPGGYSDPLNTSLLDNSDYTDDNVINGTTYYYVVTAVDTTSNETMGSNEVSALPSSAIGAMGTILREWWTGITGGSVGDLTSDPNFPDNPIRCELIKSLEGPMNWADSYGARISGYLHPPTSGDYTFWIASDANSELRLSTDGNPQNASLIANVPGFTDRRQWDKYPQQQSSPVSLAAGKKYYIEVLHKEDTGPDNVAVVWQSLPGIPQQVIYGVYLSPFFTGYYGDFTHDSVVDMNDLAEFIESWLEDDCQQTSAMDLDGDCTVNFYEFSALAENWRRTIAPSVPTNLSITASATSVSLDWDDNTESHLAGYNVYRSTTSGSGYSKLNSSLVSNSNYTDDTATNGNTYYYVVTAVDIYSKEFGYSNEVSRLVIQEDTTGFCSVDGSVKTSNSGYTGTGYADTTNASGKGIDWRINVPSSGTCTFTWRFDNGTISNRPANLLVDGSPVESGISFPGSSSWSDWRFVSVNEPLTAGTKDICLKSPNDLTGDNGLANIDYLMVTGSASLIPVSCPP